MLRITRLSIVFSLIFLAYSIRIGKIENNMIIGQPNDIRINITRDQCICYLLSSNGTISALNYFQNNQMCQLFQLNDNSVILQYLINSSFIFLNQSGNTSIDSLFLRTFL